MVGGIGNVFVDLLDTAGNAYINERFGEHASESSEGAAEYANPQTVTQPVNHSQLPSGEPLHNTYRTVMSPLGLAIGGVVLLVAGIIIARLMR